MTPPSPFFHAISTSFVRFTQDYTLFRRLAAGFSIAALLSVVATFLALTGEQPFADKSTRVLPFIYLDLTLMLLLAAILAKRLVELWIERRRGLAGSKLHVQIVGLFSLITIIPSILVAGFAAIFINVGVQSWFGEPVRAALAEAEKVAESYLTEHKKTIKHDAIDIVQELAPQVVSLMADPSTFSRILTDIAYYRRFSEVVVLTGNKQIVARSSLAFSFQFENLELDKALSAVQSGGKVAFLADLGKESIDRVRILVRLDPLTDTYLFLGKLTDKAVLRHIARTEGAVKEYSRLSEQSASLQLTFILFFSAVALLLLLAAIWGGLTIANLLMRPITRLIVAAEQVSQGDLTVQVSTDGFMNNELGNLAQAFNRMTSQLEAQRKELMSAQRKAAWSDVARRIAHEIKNPLTPIQLSAERLKRRYLKEITSDPQTFQACVETIVRQVEQIGNLISEFSSFARMPSPVMKKEDIVELCRQAVFLQKQAHPTFEFQLKVPPYSVMVRCDTQQVGQLLTNLLQNAINALEPSGVPHPSSAIIALTLGVESEIISLVVEDNGPGFPKEGRERLTEPYFTTRAKGTGLGLAIVAKIVEDHHGKLELGDSTLGGAKVTIELPVPPKND